MKGDLLISQWLSTPWALRREVLSSHAHVVAAWLKRGAPNAGDDEGFEYGGEKLSAFEARRREATSRAQAGGIAVIPVYGTVVQRAGMMTEMCGGTSTQQVSAALRDALADPGVDQILLEIDSPGGSVYGVGELAAEVYDARKAKPVVAVANSLAASAAYWIGAQASEFYVTPGGEVGSIGVWQAHEDWSAAMEASGVKTTLISAGKYKTEGNPYQPLSDESLAFMQSQVDSYYAAFVKAVARGRGVGVQQVRDGMGQGRVLVADQALAAGMVDDVLPMADVIRKMQRGARRATAQRSALATRDLSIL